MTYTLDDLPPTPTPKDYSRLQFDPSQLPKERIVGILACQREPQAVFCLLEGRHVSEPGIQEIRYSGN
jgi:hypothetical protein